METLKAPIYIYVLKKSQKGYKIFKKNESGNIDFILNEFGSESFILSLVKPFNKNFVGIVFNFNGNLKHAADDLYKKALKALFSVKSKFNNF